MTPRRDGLAPLLLTFAVAMVLAIVPLPAMAEALRPNWVALVLIYWCLETRDLVTLGRAFVAGLLLDLLSGSLLGMHGLELVILAYLVTRFRARLRFFPPWQQTLSVLALLLNDRIIVLWIIALKGDPMPGIGFWAPPVIGTLLWPWLFLLLDWYRGAARLKTTP